MPPAPLTQRVRQALTPPLLAERQHHAGPAHGQAHVDGGDLGVRWWGRGGEGKPVGRHAWRGRGGANERDRSNALGTGHWAPPQPPPGGIELWAREPGGCCCSTRADGCRASCGAACWCRPVPADGEAGPVRRHPAAQRSSPALACSHTTPLYPHGGALSAPAGAALRHALTARTRRQPIAPAVQRSCPLLPLLLLLLPPPR